MRRTIAFVIALLLLGTASAVGSAWLAAGVLHFWWNDWQLFGWRDQEAVCEVGDWQCVYQDGWDRRGWSVTRRNNDEERPYPFIAPDPPSWSVARQPMSSAFERAQVLEYEFGWPITWMRASRMSDLAAPVLHIDSTVRSAVPIDSLTLDLGTRTRQSPFGDDRGLVADSLKEAPVLPIGVSMWRGAIAAVSWSLIWLAAFLLLTAPARLRRRWRRRRGRCPSCAHVLSIGADSASLAASLRCPECGAGARSSTPFVTRARITAVLCLAGIVAIADGLWAAHLVQGHEPPPALHVASWRGDVAEIERLIEAGADPNGTIDSPTRGVARGSTPLMWASAMGRVDAIRALLRAGANPDARMNGTSRQNGALAWAASSGSIPAIRALLEGGASLTPGIWEENPAETALNAAILAGDPEMLRWLLANLPRESISDPVGDSPWHFDLAAGSEDPLILQLVIEYWEGRLDPATPLDQRLTGDWMDAIGWSITSGSIDNLKRLLARVERVDGLSTMITRAAHAGRRDHVLELLRHGVAPGCDPQFGSPLSGLIESSMTDLIAPLIDAGADPNCNADQLPLAYCVLYDEVESARTLIARGATIGDDRKRWQQVLEVINWSTMSDEMGDLIFALPASIDQGGIWDERSALRHAVAAGSEKWVKRLLDRGADPGARDEAGDNALDVARAWVSGTLSQEDEEHPVPLADRRAVLEVLERAVSEKHRSTTSPSR